MVDDRHLPTVYRIEKCETLATCNCGLYPSTVPDTTVFLVRHGEVNNPNHVVYGDLDGFHLSPRGVLQAHESAKYLASRSLDVVVTSPLARARETAAVISSHHHAPVHVDQRLMESGQFPHWTGHTWDSISSLYPGELEAYLQDATAVGHGESLLDVGQRVISAINYVAASGATCVVIVGHQDPLQAARLLLTGREISDLRLDPPLHAEVITLVSSSQRPWTQTGRWSPPQTTVRDE